MRFIKELLLAAVITVVFFAGLMSLLPDRVNVERKIEINRPISQVYDFIHSFKQFPLWSPWTRRDPATTYRYTPALTGPGAQVNWFSRRDTWVGEGGLQIVDQSRNEWINYTLDAPWRGKKTADLTVSENEAGAIVTTFAVHVDYGWDLFGRVMGRYLDGHIGDNLAFSLGQLKNRIEALPDVDYAEMFADDPPVEVEMAPINVLLIPGQASTREPYSVQPTLENFVKILTATIDIKKLTQTGPRLAVLKRWGQTYDFDAAVPVEETEANDLPENVVFTTIGGGPYLKVLYQGPRWDLPRRRDMLLAWAGANGYPVTGRIIEEFLNDRGDSNELRDADLETNLYLPIGANAVVADAPAVEETPEAGGDDAESGDAERSSGS